MQLSLAARILAWVIYVAIFIFLVIFGPQIVPNGHVGETQAGSILVLILFASVPICVCLPVFVERRRLGLRQRPIEFLLSYFLLAIWTTCHFLGIGPSGTLGNLVEPFYLLPLIGISMVFANFFLDLSRKKAVLTTIQILTFGAAIVVIERLLIPIFPE